MSKQFIDNPRVTWEFYVENQFDVQGWYRCSRQTELEGAFMQSPEKPVIIGSGKYTFTVDFKKCNG